MPSTSPAQHRLMEAVAHDPGVAKKTGIPQSVGKDFAAADHARSLHDKAKGKENAAGDHARQMHQQGEAEAAKRGG